MRTVSQGIVNLHGGSLKVTSDGEGKGACFTIELPLIIEESTEPKIPPSNTSVCGGYYWTTAVGRLWHTISRISPYANTNQRKVLHRLSTSKIGVSVMPLTTANNHHEFPQTEVDVPPSDSHIINQRLTRRYSSPRNRVLIVDDAPLNRKMLRRLLSSRFEVCDEAENGEEAVNMVKASLSGKQQYDVVTMDYQMPVMDGVTASHHIRELGFNGIIIGITGNALSDDVRSFLSNGASTVLIKPLSIKDFDDFLSLERT